MKPTRRQSPPERALSRVEDHPNLSGGLAVVVAVTMLLELLRRAVGNRLDTEITRLWITGRQLSQNVVGTHLLQDTVTQSEKLVAELEQHVETREETVR